MSTNKQAREVQRYAQYGVDMMEWSEGGYVLHSDYLALLDELEAAQNRSVELPSFDGYVPHIAKELQAAFKIACAAAGITVKGE